MSDEEKRCEYERADGKPCPHRYYLKAQDPETFQEKGWCVFHCPTGEIYDRDKGDFVNKTFDFREKLEEYVRLEITRLGSADRANESAPAIDFEGFRFPELRKGFVKRRFPLLLDFSKAVFTEDADFRGSFFGKGAVFYRTVFEKEFSVSEAVFKGRVEFVGARFEGVSGFIRTRFYDLANFRLVKFNDEVLFMKTKFRKTVDFSGSEFGGPVNFWKAVFFGEAKFGSTKFRDKTDFRNSFALGLTTFNNTEFSLGVDFRYLDTGPRKGFCGCSVGPGFVVMNCSLFAEPRFVWLGGRETKFEKWSFAGTNIEGVNFVHEVWGEKNPKWFERFLKLQRKRKYVYDEDLARGNNEPPLIVTWADVSAVYRRLRKNYEFNLAYDDASDFHYGQMECRRHDVSKKWWHWERVSTFIYWFLSGYGESYWRPLAWLFFLVFAVSPLLLLWPGVPSLTDENVKWYINLNFGSFSFPAFKAALAYSVNTVLSLKVTESNVWLSIVANLERIFAVVLGTFTVLALRRRFKR
jgi:uncharacterized protein YjbI with pentapeptide repeats